MPKKNPLNRTHFAAIEELLKKKLAIQRAYQGELAKIAEEERQLELKLLSATPKCLRDFISGRKIIANVLAFGEDTDIFGLGAFGVRSYAHAAQRLKTLQAAWKGLIVISIPSYNSFIRKGRLLRLGFKAFRI